MKLTFLGAAQTVTGSEFLLEVNGSRLLLDCGLFQGKRQEFYKRNQTFDFDVHTLDSVLLSHAHIDHSGNLPNLVKNGYSGPIYTTRATADLSDVMLRDSGHIQEADIQYVNRKRDRRGEPPLEPLYTIADAAAVNDYFSTKDYGQVFEPVPGVQARFVDAGHILGSASIVLDIEENRKKIRLWYSGDIGRNGLPLMRDPTLPENADFLMMECTYGDKLHEDPEAAYVELRDSVKRTFDRGGKVIIPSFAVGRTQELVYNFNRLIAEGEIQPFPIYVDSPLAVNVTEIFQKHQTLFDAETQAFIREKRHPALDFPQLTYIRSVEDSKALNDRKDPMVIISASGMAETGRILHHLKNNIQNPRNTVLIVSWQAPNTLGRRLADREATVRIFGELFDRRAEVVTIGGFSAHAGQNMLLHYAQVTSASLKEIFLVHGEPNPARILMEKMSEHGLNQLKYPAYQQKVDL